MNLLLQSAFRLPSPAIALLQSVDPDFPRMDRAGRDLLEALCDHVLTLGSAHATSHLTIEDAKKLAQVWKDRLTK